MWQSLVGYYSIEITCGSVSDILTKLNNRGIYIRHVKITDDLHVNLEIARVDMTAVAELIESNGAEMRILQKKGVYWICVQMIKRPALLLGFAFVVVLSLFLSTRILFVNVVGNEHLAEKYILEKAELCGVRFGASRREVRSESVKNELLEQLSQLRWAGVNTTGCVATIIVKERDLIEQSENDCNVGKIIAIRDGIIRQMVVKKGSAMCRVGQAVKAGQTLVSGYTDTGLTIKAEVPVAEILATTQREICAVAPACGLKRGVSKDVKTLYQIRIGKKLIKFYKDSGILGAGCVKMYTEKSLVLPGGFVLPIALIKITVTDYILTEYQHENMESFHWLSTYAEEYINNQMHLGQVVETQDSLSLSGGNVIFAGRYLCTEMIGRVQDEEIITGNGKRN